jgi:hypothetical protein
MHISFGLLRRVSVALVALIGAGCSTDPAQAPPVPASIAKVAGATSATLGDRLADPVVVEVRDAAGEPMAGVTVNFEVMAPGAAIERTEAVTDTEGRAGTGWRLGLTVGPQELRATLPEHATVPALAVTATATTAAVRSLSGGANVMCAVLGDGHLGCWIPPRDGDPAEPLRLAATTERFTSVAVAIRRQFAGAETMPGCATSESGRLWCFEVSPTDAGIAALAEKAGAYPAMATVHTGTAPFFADPPFCALGTAGAVYCWGRNTEGVLGDGTTTDRATPGPVSGGGTYHALSVGRTHACALAVDNTAWCWGKNTLGQVDLPAVAVTSEPTLAGGGATFSSVVALQQDATCGVRTTGGLACWGDATIVGGASAGAPASPLAVVGIDGAVIVLASGSAAGWGDFFPSSDAYPTTPVSLAFPAGFTEVLAGHTSELLCGRTAPGAGAFCQRLSAATRPIAGWTGSSPGFGVPSP